MKERSVLDSEKSKHGEMPKNYNIYSPLAQNSDTNNEQRSDLADLTNINYIDIPETGNDLSKSNNHDHSNYEANNGINFAESFVDDNLDEGVKILEHPNISRKKKEISNKINTVINADHLTESEPQYEIFYHTSTKRHKRDVTSSPIPLKHSDVQETLFRDSDVDLRFPEFIIPSQEEAAEEILDHASLVRNKRNAMPYEENEEQDLQSDNHDHVLESARKSRSKRENINETPNVIEASKLKIDLKNNKRLRRQILDYSSTSIKIPDNRPNVNNENKNADAGAQYEDLLANNDGACIFY